MEDVYFPVISPQEYENSHTTHDKAIKQQHSKLIDRIVSELTVLTQVLQGFNDENDQANNKVDTNGETTNMRTNISKN